MKTVDNVGKITETDSEKSMSVQALKRACFELARSNFQGKIFTNTNSTLIRVSRDGLDEWFSKTKSREQALSIKLLDDFLKNGNKIAENTDSKTRHDVDGFDYYEYKCKINGAEYNAIISVKKTKNNTDKYYHHFLQDIKIEPRSGYGTDLNNQVSNAPLLHDS